jgi:hypothetical protein
MQDLKSPNVQLASDGTAKIADVVRSHHTQYLKHNTQACTTHTHTTPQYCLLCLLALQNTDSSTAMIYIHISHSLSSFLPSPLTFLRNCPIGLCHMLSPLFPICHKSLSCIYSIRGATVEWNSLLMLKTSTTCHVLKLTCMWTVGFVQDAQRKPDPCV